MAHPDLENAIRLLNPAIGPESPLEEFWRTMPAGPFVKGSFWQVLTSKLRFARSADSQKRLADWIFEKHRRADVWPPVPIITKSVFQPIPRHDKSI